MRPPHAPLSADAPIALGYMQVPLLAEPDRVGALMRHRAQSWGYRWGGTHFDHHTHGHTIAALAQHASREPDVWLIVVPDATHLPGGRRLLTTRTMVIRIVTPIPTTAPPCTAPERGDVDQQLAAEAHPCSRWLHTRPPHRPHARGHLRRTPVSTHPPTPPLPDMNRLVALWDGVANPVTNLEHAARVAVTLWMTCLDGVDFSNPGDVQDRLLKGVEADPDHTVIRVIDDEVTWYLGNRPGAVVFVDDDFPEIVTAGQLIDRLSMWIAISATWSPQLGDCPFTPAIAEFGRRYDALITGLLTGSRQPRRRADGMPPVQRPRRIELIAVPHRDGGREQGGLRSPAPDSR